MIINLTKPLYTQLTALAKLKANNLKTNNVVVSNEQLITILC